MSERLFYFFSQKHLGIFLNFSEFSQAWKKNLKSWFKRDHQVEMV